LLRVSDLKVVKSNKSILDGISFTLNPGDRMILSGESGSGKSTLIRSLLLFESLIAGEIRWQDELVVSRNVQEYRKHFVYVGQRPPAFDGSVSDYIQLPYSFRFNCSEMPSEQKIYDALSRFDLSEDVLNQSYSALSGGEQQRVTLIQGLLLDRPVLLLDEVTSSLDPANVNRVVDSILEDTKQIVISVSHQDRWQKAGVLSYAIREGKLIPKGSE